MRLPEIIGKALLFFLPPLLAVELIIRVLLPGPFAGVQRLMDFYQVVRTGPAPVHYLFIGSSRVAAAIDIATFRHVLRTDPIFADSAETLHLYNLGQGYSTLAEHYLALRRLPDSLLQYTTLFIGLEHGIPPGDLFTDTWSGPWTDPRWPLLLSPILRLSDLLAFWRHADNSVHDKLIVTAGVFLYSVRYGRFIRAKAHAWIHHLPFRLGLRQPPPPTPSPLTARGGIRTDSAAIAEIRHLILEQLQQNGALPPDSVIPNWNQTVFADLVRLLQAHRGRVVVFNLPLPSWHRQTDRPTPEKVQSFKQWAKAHSVLILDVPVNYPDEAFPDLIHLADAYAPDFTQRLAQAYRTALDTQQANSSP